MMSDTKADFNATSAWQLSPTVYTILLGHVSGNFKTYDMNDDGFRDDPKMLQFNVANRWLYYTPELQVRWGVKAVRDHRQGGMDGYDKSGMEPRWASDEFILEPTEGNSFAKYLSESPWGTDITNSLLNAYLKVGKPLREDGSSSIAAIADWSWQKSDSWFGASSYLASQHSGFINLLYRNMLNESHDFTVGLSGTFDHIDEAVANWTTACGVVRIGMGSVHIPESRIISSAVLTGNIPSTPGTYSHQLSESALIGTRGAGSSWLRG